MTDWHRDKWSTKNTANYVEKQIYDPQACHDTKYFYWVKDKKTILITSLEMKVHLIQQCLLMIPFHGYPNL